MLRKNLLFFIDETHIRKGSYLDLTALDHLNTTFIDRDNGMKEGGGKLIIISQ